jgi:hypothetical protein
MDAGFSFSALLNVLVRSADAQHVKEQIDRILNVAQTTADCAGEICRYTTRKTEELRWMLASASAHC